MAPAGWRSAGRWEARLLTFLGGFVVRDRRQRYDLQPVGLLLQLQFFPQPVGRIGLPGWAEVVQHLGHGGGVDQLFPQIIGQRAGIALIVNDMRRNHDQQFRPCPRVGLAASQ